MKLIDLIEKYAITFLFVIMVILNFANAMARFILSVPISFTEEIIIFCFIWLSMLGISAAFKEGQHMSMDFLVDKFGVRGKKVFLIFSTLCSMVMLTLLFILGIGMIKNQMFLQSKTAVMGWSEWWQGLAIPTGSILCIIRTIDFSYKQMKIINDELKLKR